MVQEEQNHLAISLPHGPEEWGTAFHVSSIHIRSPGDQELCGLCRARITRAFVYRPMKGCKALSIFEVRLGSDIQQNSGDFRLAVVSSVVKKSPALPVSGIGSGSMPQQVFDRLNVASFGNSVDGLADVRGGATGKNNQRHSR